MVGAFLAGAAFMAAVVSAGISAKRKDRGMLLVSGIAVALCVDALLPVTLLPVYLPLTVVLLGATVVMALRAHRST